MKLIRNFSTYCKRLAQKELTIPATDIQYDYKIVRQDPKKVEHVFQQLSKNLDSNSVSRGESIRQLHGSLISYHKVGQYPDIVVQPKSTEEISIVHKICYENEFPIIPFGTATSLEGHILATHGGVSLDVNMMNKITEFSPEDMYISVQPGITREQVNEYVKEHGLFFPIDPGANASIGGMTATRASGTNAVRYGTMKDNILRLEVVMPNGNFFKTAQKARKSSAGYDLTRLFIGSEGTLGTISEVTLKLYGIPEQTIAAVCPFDNINQAAQTVMQVIQYGIPISRVEIMDETSIRAVNQYSKLSLQEKPTLFFEFAGSVNTVQEQTELVQDFCKENGGLGFVWAKEEAEKRNLWKARHNAYFASLALKPGTKALTTDVCVPISRFADCITQTKEDFDKTGVTYTIVGHSGDGNFHCICCVDDQNAEELKRLEDAYHRLIHRALEMEGTCTGEHGVGLKKIDYMLMELGVGAVETMKQIKEALDPKNIMNPSKVIPSKEMIDQFKQMYPNKK